MNQLRKHYRLSTENASASEPMQTDRQRTENHGFCRRRRKEGMMLMLESYGFVTCVCSPKRERLIKIEMKLK
jgi:hypothetical protein